MACRELLENSFPYDEPILVRAGEKVTVVKIGDFVEKRLSGIDTLERQYKRLQDRVEVLTLDDDMKLTFRRVVGVFRHKSPEKLWKITLQSGREIRTTSSHNVFVLTEDLRVACKETRFLEPGERVLVPNGSLETSGGMTEIDVLEELMNLSPQQTGGIVVRGLAKSYPPKPTQSQLLLATVDGAAVSWTELRTNASELGMKSPQDVIYTLRRGGFLRNVRRGEYRVNRSKKTQRRYGVPRDWAHCDAVPFNYFRSRPPPNLDDSRLLFSVKQGRRGLPSKIPVTRELMRILGYFSSEGSIHADYKVTFSFGSHELDTHVRDLVHCLRQVFGVEPIITREHGTAVNVVINDSMLAFFFTRVLGTGTRSSDKRVPWVVFSAVRAMAEEYLNAYVRGDGYVQLAKRNRKITLVTSSRSLFTDLRFLLTLLGRHFTASFDSPSEREIKGVKTRFRGSHLIYIREGLAPESSSVPIDHYRKELVSARPRLSNLYRSTVQKKWLKDHFRSDEMPRELRNFVLSDAGALAVKSVQQVDSDSEWVYDLSVEEVERFIGGDGIALLHNSMDAAELYGVLPEIYVRLISENSAVDAPDPKPYRLSVVDNGPGVEPSQVPSAFGKVFYGSKYVLRQSRGMFGLGGTMAILYGQITTNKPVLITSSADGKKRHSFEMIIDIAENKPVVLKRESTDAGGKTGTRVDLTLEGDYLRASQKIIDYLRQTALVASYANLAFVDPQGQLTFFERATTSMPPAPKETLPHPHGIDVEALKRIIKLTEETTMLSFMKTHFHRVGEKIAKKFLEFAGISPRLAPKRLSNQQIVAMVGALQNFQEFLQPDASVLSPVGEEILQAGITKELQPEFSAVVARPPSSYSGFPFLVEVGMAYGGKVLQPGLKLFRFANRIPLLYDESSDVSFKVMNEEIDWRRYHVPQDAPLGVITHIASTKIPYKTVGKEYIADRPEIEKELRNATREALRRLSIYLSRKGSMEAVQRKMNIYGKYLPLIARFSADLAGLKKLPDYKKLMGKTKEVEGEVEGEVTEAETMGAEPAPQAAEGKKEIEQKKIEEYSGE